MEPGGCCAGTVINDLATQRTYSTPLSLLCSTISRSRSLRDEIIRYYTCLAKRGNCLFGSLSRRSKSIGSLMRSAKCYQQDLLRRNGFSTVFSKFLRVGAWARSALSRSADYDIVHTFVLTIACRYGMFHEYSNCAILYSMRPCGVQH